MADGVTDTESTILDAARDEVLAYGIRKTTASDIAKRAGIARQTLYRYYPDAQAVFAALVTRELVAVLPVAAPPAETLDELVGMLVATAGAIRRMPLVDRLRETDPELFGRYLLERLGTTQRVIVAETARRLAAAQQSGAVRAGEPERLAAMVLLIAQSAVLSAPLVTEWISGDAWADELTLALRGYLGA
ncbi:TetR/AcrR family transcriptional regulator [Microbacterium sp.]|uniref:TetR/AcrR family transcriptional regulator n=1 Tax=Microbacterium sp. TaxID=51671 RepID=UPI003F6F1D4E